MAMIKCINKKGQTTNFNKDSFLKIKPDKEGRRNGWIIMDGSEGIAASKVASANIPTEMKVFKPGEAKNLIPESEVNTRIKAAQDELTLQHQSTINELAEKHQIELNGFGEKLKKQDNEFLKLQEFIIKEHPEKIIDGSPIDNAINIIKKLSDVPAMGDAKDSKKEAKQK